MSDEKPSRRDILRPLHLLLIALGCGVFAMVVTLVSTGAFTARVNASIANGTYDGLTPVALGLVVGGGAFIATLLILAMLMLAIDPADVTKTVDRPVLYDPEPEADSPASPSESGDRKE
jgi:amino acid transporter